MLIVSWIVRFGHVAFAALWVGGYAMIAFEAIPAVAHHPERASRVIQQIRLLTYVGVLVLGFGIALITRTQGFGQLIGSAWGTCILLGILIAVTLLGIGDGVLRPALLKQSPAGIQRARRAAILGFALTIVAVGLMTGATYLG
jgi:hypothetical protein